MKRPLQTTLLSKIGPVQFDIPTVGKVYFHFEKIFRLTATNISAKLYTLPEQSAFWRHCHVRLKAKLREIEHELRITESVVHIEAHNHYVKSRAPHENLSPSEAYIRSRVTINGRVEEERRAVHDLQEKVDILAAIVAAFEDQRMSLMSLGAAIRAQNRPATIAKDSHT